jgi:glucosamine-phosphate N-acetyltransferase
VAYFGSFLNKLPFAFRQHGAAQMAVAKSEAALRLVTTPQLVEVVARRLVVPFAGCCCGLYLFLRRRRLVRQLALQQSASAGTTTTTKQPKGLTTDFSTTLSLRLRPLENRDFSNYFLQLLAELTTVGELPKSWCEQRLRMIDRDELQEVVVLEDLGNAQVCGAATLVVESKFIHECGRVGHLEDVVVHAGLRGKGLGKKLVERVTELARERGCYKILVDCTHANIAFYESCGYNRKDAQMARYFDVYGEALPAADPESSAAELRAAVELGSNEKGVFRFRPLRQTDRAQFLRLLAQLTTVGEVG